MKNFFQKGFTLVELMVVVAIIGLLSAVAIPNFKKYQAKSKTSEAKLQLSAVYMSEQSFAMDYNAYGTCLNIMGYDPSKEVKSRYYAVGFSEENSAANAYVVSNGQAPSACSVTNVPYDNAAADLSDNSKGYYAYTAGKKVNNQAFITGTQIKTSFAGFKVTGTDYDSFKAGAVGVISGDFIGTANADIWSIDQDKIIKQERVGF